MYFAKQRLIIAGLKHQNEGKTSLVLQLHFYAAKLNETGTELLLPV